jgi:predicted dehydrogenase
MSKFTRRQFLEDSLFASAAAAMAVATPRLGQAQEAKLVSTSVAERLNTAIIGTGGRGTGSHVGEFLDRKDCLITHVCDADERLANRAADRVERAGSPRPKVVLDMRRVFDDPSVHIISTATPNHWHALTSIWAMQAGKDVYVEKPASHNVTEGRRMVQVARATGRICQVGTQSRSAAGMRQAIKALQDGKIGEVKLARCLCYKPRSSIGPRGKYEVPSSVNFDLWTGPAPLKDLTRPKLHYDWHWQWDYGNGDIGNQGVHEMDRARWGLNLDRLSNAVLAYGGRFGYEDAGETANTQVAIHDFGDKTIVFEVRGLETDSYKGAKVGVIYYGSEGYMVSGGYSGGTFFDLQGKKLESFGQGGDEHHFANFLDAVRSRRHEDLTADVLEGHLSAALCHLSNISYRLGEKVSPEEARDRLAHFTNGDKAGETFERFASHLADNKVKLADTGLQFGPPLSFDPAQEKFKDSAEANALLTREYREPFVVPKDVSA